MHDPYLPPQGGDAEEPVPRVRLAHSMVALTSGLVVTPLLLFGLFFVVLGDEVNSVGNWRFWASVVGGSVLAALAVYPFKKLPLWAAFIAGPAAVLVLVAVGVAVYALTTA